MQDVASRSAASTVLVPCVTRTHFLQVLIAIGETKEKPMAVTRLTGKIERWFGYVVLGAIGLGLVAALVGVLVALMGAHVSS